MKILKQCLSNSTLHFLRLAIFLFFGAQYVCGQPISDSSRSDRDQQLQQYEAARDRHYQRLAELGDPASAEIGSLRANASEFFLFVWDKLSRRDGMLVKTYLFYPHSVPTGHFRRYLQKISCVCLVGSLKDLQISKLFCIFTADNFSV